MAEFEDREHYIPLRKGDLIKLVTNDSRVPLDQREPLKAFCTLTSAIYHFEYLERLDKLKDYYAPFDPDTQTEPLKKLDETQLEKTRDRMFDEVVSLMERANFTRLTHDDVQAAIDGGASDWGLNMTVNFDIFEKMEVFIRGDTVGERTRRHSLWFWKKITKKVEIYKRIVLILKMRKHKSLPALVDISGVYLKLFKDIPKLDLEMVMPGAKIQMPKGTKYKLGGSLLGTIGYALYSVGMQLWTFIVSAAVTTTQFLMGPFVVIAGYGYKQWYSFNVTKQTYSKMLTESLYYQTLDNNGGVLTHLIDEAEEQECREAILAYWALLYHGPEQGWTQEQLDDYIELFLENSLGMKIDFEVDDALEKVLKLGIVEQTGNKLKAVPLEKALEKLDYRWDNYFQYNV